MRKHAQPATTKTTRPTKLGPGEYRPDPTKEIQRIEDLPKPKIIKQDRNYAQLPCPRCGHGAYRDQVFVRPLGGLMGDHGRLRGLAGERVVSVSRTWRRSAAGLTELSLATYG